MKKLICAFLLTCGISHAEVPSWEVMIDPGARDTERLNVPGGWAVKVNEQNQIFTSVFVPDPNHQWNDISHDWEYVCCTGTNNRTDRLNVFGGWMLKMMGTYHTKLTSIFVPDPNHEWVITQ